MPKSSKSKPSKSKVSKSKASKSTLAAKKPSASVAVVSELMMPHQVNNLGHVFGGELLSMVDRAAAVAAMRHAGRNTVTVSIDRVDFKEPIYTGELVTCTARVNFVGRTSMEVGVHVEAEDLLSGTLRHTNTCFLTFVAIDEHHRPCRVPPLDVSDPEDERRQRDGMRRRQVREALDRELDRGSA
jgi:acyl-CoA hydrolase